MRRGQRPLEKHPAEERPTEECPTEECPAEECPAEECPAEERPAEKCPTGERPAEECPVENRPLEERSTENRSAGERRRALKKRFAVCVAVFCLLCGVSILLVRPIGVSITSRRQAAAIASYVEAVGRLSAAEREAIKEQALEYNRRIAATRPYIWSSPYGDSLSDYQTALAVPGTDVIAYIEIPSINVSLPIYRFSSDRNMRRGCGHAESTSLPVGGTSSHSVLLSHRTMAEAITFEHLDRLRVGDVFFVTVLTDTLTYRVESVRVVDPKKPEDYAFERVEEGREICTLVTCTPKISNTHRLFVRGVRVEA